MAAWLDVLMSILPVGILIFLMVKKNGVPAYKALPSMAIFLYLERLIYFETNANVTNAAVVKGMLSASVPIAIIWGAIFLFKTMENSSSMDSIRLWLRSVTDVPVAQVMIIAWAFAFMIEGFDDLPIGSSGFGTPAALGAPLLVGLGFPAEKAALVTLILNTVPVIFGAVGMPTWFGLGGLSLDDTQLLSVGRRSALLNSTLGLVIPPIALLFIVPPKDILKNIFFIYLSLLSTLVPFLLISFVSYDFPSIVGGIIGLALTVLLAKFKVGMFKKDFTIPFSDNRYIHSFLTLNTPKENSEEKAEERDVESQEMKSMNPEDSTPPEIPPKIFKKIKKNNLSPVPTPKHRHLPRSQALPMNQERPPPSGKFLVYLIRM